MKEEELAAQVVSWLRDQEWVVYQEVMCHDKVCDIVAERGGVLWAIECKTTLSLAVMAQAHYWRKLSNHSSVAVPGTYRRRSSFSKIVLRDYGIGQLVVHPDAAAGPSASVYRLGPVRESIKPELNDNPAPALRSALSPEQQTWAAAGNARGARFTPFQRTKAVVQSVVKQEGSIQLGDLISNMDHHYASDKSARAALLNLIEGGVISGVTIRRVGRMVSVEAATE